MLTKFSMLLILYICHADLQRPEDNGDDAKVATERREAILPAENAAWEDSLKKYFEPEQIVKIKQARKQFDEIKTAADLAAFYFVTLDTVKTMVNEQISFAQYTMMPRRSEYEYENMLGIDERWSWFHDYFPSIKCALLCGLCPYHAHTDLLPLMEKAKHTPEKEDDLFFELAMVTYRSENSKGVVYDGLGEYGEGLNGSGDSLGQWGVTLSCDRCMASTLGGGYYYRIVQSVEKAASARKLFGVAIDRYLTFTLSVIYNLHFYHPKVKVLSEIDKILASPVLKQEQKKQLRADRERINTETEIKFGCGTIKCEWSY
jgi:hypothetical protein